MGNEQSNARGSRSAPPSPLPKGRTAHDENDSESPPPVPAKTPDTGIHPLPPPYTLVDPTTAQRQGQGDERVLRRVTARALDSVTGRSRRPLSEAPLPRPPNTAPLPGQRSSMAPAPAPQPLTVHRRTTSHSAAQGPTAPTKPPTRPRVQPAHKTSQSSSGSRAPTLAESPVDNVGGFRAQMRRDTPPASNSGRTTPAAGTRHTKVTVMPLATAGDVLGNPMRSGTSSSNDESAAGPSTSSAQKRSKPISTALQRHKKDPAPEQSMPTPRSYPPQRRNSVEDPLEYLRKYVAHHFTLVRSENADAAKPYSTQVRYRLCH